MKTVIKLMTCLALVAGMSLTVSYAGPKPKEVKNVPCQGSKYMSDKNYYRAQGIGESRNISQATDNARMRAQQALASMLEVMVKNVNDLYVSEYVSNDKDDFSSRMQGVTRTVVKQTLNGAVPCCNPAPQTYKNKKGDIMYRAYMVLELSKASVENGMKAAISKDEKLMIDFEYDKYLKIMNEEMEKYGQENQ